MGLENPSGYTILKYRDVKNLENFCKIAQERIKSFSKGQTLFFYKDFKKAKLFVEDRKSFRKFLVQQIKAQKFYQTENFFTKKEFSLDPLLDIGSRPEHPLLALSISHCKNLACFVLSISIPFLSYKAFQKSAEFQNIYLPTQRQKTLSLFDTKNKSLLNKKIKQKKSIGLDFEETHRVSRLIVSRVSHLKELNSSPSPCLLWTAKEASFKCFSESDNKLILSDCLISDWSEIEEKDSLKKSYFFKAKSKNQTGIGIAFSVDNLTLAYTEKVI